MKTAEELLEEFKLKPYCLLCSKAEDDELLDFMRQIQQDAIQSSDNYKKGYLDACDEIEKIITQHVYGTRGSGNPALIPQVVAEHQKTKRKEFGL